MDISSRIRRFRQAMGLNQEQLAEALGVSQGTVSRWEKGSSPRGEHLQLLAEFFGKTVDELCGMRRISVGLPLRVIGCVEAGVFRETNQFPPDDQYEISTPEPRRSYGDKAFGLEVHGTSMNHFYRENDILICVSLHDLERDLVDGGHVIVFRQNGAEHEATCKELRIVGGNHWLWPRSHDPEHQAPIQLSETDFVTVQAVVIGAYTDRS
jgi:transcriptional regulator with XRE-family HTH domain